MAFNWFKKKKKQGKDEIPQAIKEPENLSVEGIDEDEQTETHVIPESVDASVAGSEMPHPPEDNSTLNISEEVPEALEQNTDADESTPPEKKSGGFFARLKKGLTKTREILNTNIEDLFVSSKVVDDDMLEELEEMLITSDIGVQTSMAIIERIAKKASKIKTAKDLKNALKNEFLALLPENPAIEKDASTGPRIVMVVGVNGVGKTTTIGKLAAKLASENKKGLVVAADTFRAAAVEQLAIWAQRANVPIIKHKENADPAAVAFDGVSAAIARNVDTVYIDTAGRLHTKTNLMEELKKIKRSIAKKLPGAPHEILLVLDATTGQNAISQAKLFNEALDLTGIILTKLDGTAKGGIVLSICNTLGIPLTYVGVGESIEDLQTFDPVEFVNALL